MERVPRMCLGAVFGAVVGMFIAFKVAHAYWWTGILIGSPAGMLVFNWGDTVNLLFRAWRALRDESGSTNAGRRMKALEKETLPTCGWRSACRKFALAITIFFWWLGWKLVADAAFMYFFPHFNGQTADYIATIAPIMLCGMWLEDRWPQRMSKERAEYIARAFMKSACLMVLSWQMLRALLWIRNHPFKTIRIALFIATLPFYTVWCGLVVCFSHDSLIVGFSAAMGIIAGYLSKSWSIGIVVALAMTIIGVVFLAKPARRWMRDYG